MNPKDLDFFDSIAPTWDSIISVDDQKIAHILDVAALKEGDSVLDVGTGTGVLIPYIAARIGASGSIHAIDISLRMLAEARRKHGAMPNLRLDVVDVEADTLPEQYDHIIMYCMYPHLTTPEDTVEWLAKLNLKPGGTLVIAFPESKEAINSIHHHNDGSVHSDHLIDANLLRARYAARGLDADYAEDTPDTYIIRITKSIRMESVEPFSWAKLD